MPRKWTDDRIWMLSAAAALAMVCIVFGIITHLGEHYNGSAEHQRGWVRHGYQVLEKSRSLLTAIDEAESGERGFILTGAPAYLVSYGQARQAIPELLGKLSDLTADNPEQRQRIQELREPIGRRLVQFADAIAVRQEEGLEAASRLVLSYQGHTAMGAIRGDLEQIIAAEDRLLRERTEKARADERMTRLISYGTVVLTGLGMAALLLLLARGRRRVQELEAASRQSQKMEAIGQLTGGIAHDFNNLLQIILSNLDMAARRIDGGNALAECLHNTLAAADQAATLTRQLLAFGRRQELRPEAVRTERLVNDMTALLRRTLGERIDVRMVCADGLWPALADANQLQNALLNLAINARDAMPGGGKLTIELANAHLEASRLPAPSDPKPGDYVVLAVSDTGTGMPAHVIERAFEPFFTTKPEGAGTGLGLSMVYGFAKQSGGHVKIYSEPGHGTTVKLYLPRTDASPDEMAAPAALRRGRGETVLLVEDDGGVRQGVARQLAELGYGVLAARDADEAMGLAQDNRIDLLFTDLVMPGGMDGQGLAARLRSERPDLPVVFASGYTEAALLHDERIAEGQRVLCKPYSLSQLAEAIGDALDAHGFLRPHGDLVPLAPPMPHKAPPCRAATSQSAGKPATTADEDWYSMTILLVEDEALLRQAMVDILELFGYRVLAAGTAGEAVSMLAQEEGIAAMISDLSLPDFNGLTLARKALEQRPDLPVIIATGHDIAATDLPDPSVVVLSKPYHPDQLKRTLEELLARQPSAMGRCANLLRG